MEQQKNHPLKIFRFCPKCGSREFIENNEKSKKCLKCGFVYYFNPSSAVAGFVRNGEGELLVARRGSEPAKGTLDLPGGFVDCYETPEQAIAREVQEETGLEVQSVRYLFSIPNIYPYSGFDVHTVDMVFECEVDSFEGAKAEDDVSSLHVVAPDKLNADDFGLTSIREAVERYKSAAAQEE